MNQRAAAAKIPTVTDLTESVSCPMCRATTYSVVLEARYPAELTDKGLLEVYSSSSDHVLMDQLVRCGQCGLAYLNPRIREDLILASYRGAVDETFIAQNNERVATFQRSLQRVLKAEGIEAGAGIRVLDVGCAGGAFLIAARNLGLKATGIEPSRWLSEQARTRYGLDVRTGTLAEQDLPKAAFDIVTLWDVLEHLSDPAAELQRVRALLKDNGLLIVNYPDFGSAASRLLGRKWPFLLSVHLTYFTRGTIRTFLARQGFAVRDIRTHWQTLALGYVLRRAGAYFSLFGSLGRLVDTLGMGGLPLRYTIGQTLVVCRKSA